MKVAVIILNWNGARMMQQFLPSVVNNTPDAEIVVADNGSTDDSLQVLKDEFPSVRTVVLDKNYGFAEGYNRAIAAVECDYVVLLNSDVEVPESWLKPLVEYMNANPEVSACQPKLLAHHDKQMFEYAGASGGYIDCYGYPFCRGRIFSVVEHDEGQYNNVADVHWATGACMLVRRDVYQRLGGLDARFFAHNEEIDLCWRMRLNGYRIVCIPDSYVYHVGGGTLPQGNPRKTYLNFRNNLTMLYKNLPDSDLNKVMRLRFILDCIAMMQSLAKFNIGDVKAIIKARKDCNAWKPEYSSIRKAIQQQASVKTSLVMPYSILWQFFIKRKQKYSELG